MQFILAEYVQLVKGFPKNEEVVKWLNWLFAFYNIDNPLRVSAFLARIGHECASFNTLEESASGQAYEGRKDLGNTSKGDGVKYKGKGWIMITGKNNYSILSKAYNKDFVSKPELLKEIEWAAKSCGWYWNLKDLNKLADKGNIKEITRIINGGYNGLIDTQTRYVRCLQWFKSKGYS
jgi:putative chitinase